MRVLLLLVFACPFSISAPLCEEDVKKLEWIDHADAKNNALNAIKHGDFNYIAIYPYTNVIPGVSAKQAQEIINKEQFKPMEGITDDICSEKHAELNKKAIAYAAIYNSVIKNHKR